MNKKLIFVTCFFITLTFVFTYPLILKIRSSIPGTYTTDESFAWLAYFWWLKYAFKHHLADMNYSFIAAPFGLDISKLILPPSWNLFSKWLSIFTDSVISYNIQILLSFILSGIATFYLAFILTKDKLTSLFAGIVYAFCPYHFVRAWQHLSLVQIQWMPFYILTLVKLQKFPTYKHVFLSIIALVLVISFEFHYTYFMFVTTVLLLIYSLVFYKKEYVRYLRFLKMTLIVMAVGMVFIASIAINKGLMKTIIESRNIRPSAWNVIRPFNDLFTQSARPLSYFLPATAHPVFGKFTENFIGTPLYGDSLTEHTLYLGWVPLLLAFIAFKRWRKKRKQLPVASYQPPEGREDFYIGFFIFLAITAWLFSQPPWWQIGPFKIYMPSFFMYKILPMIRAYCRFGIVVMLAVAILAGFGLKEIISKLKTQNSKLAAAILSCGLILFEFWNYPPFKLIDVSKVPPVYYWIKNQPGDFAIAEYPLDADSPNELYKLYQTKHEKKIINGTTPGTDANKVAQGIVRLSETATVVKLKEMGVKYALVHYDGYLQTDLLEEKEELGRIPKNPSLKLVKSFPAQECPRKDIMCVQKTGQIDVYEIEKFFPSPP